jgi:copper homeostasis protein
MSKDHYQLEVCVDRLDHAIRAAEAGATRIEYNSALSLGGLTPSVEQCRILVDSISPPIVAMLRPHADSFCYTTAEQLCLFRECSALLELGIAGIVFGQMTDSGDIDFKTLEEMARLCQGRELILHRVFDELDNQLEAMPAIIDAGVNRILTSGGAANAVQGCQQIRQLHDRFGSQIEILPGGGVTSNCLHNLIRETHCNQFHGSFRRGGRSPDYREIQAAIRILDQAFDDGPGD